MISGCVAEKPDDHGRRGPLRAFYEWVKGGASSAPAPGAPAGTTEAETLPSRIGRYAITRRLGQGGMGVVYEARDERLERSVALKTMSALASDETARKRFWREARAAASVNHPNICQIYEIGDEAGELFIAMELLEGEPLSERLKRGALSVTDSVPIGLGMLAALSALHSRSIVHRDLKPSNVFLTPHGVKLLDFGLARPELERGAETFTGLTQTGMVVGTPRYMAPEQATGQTIDIRTDLFAAGAILFEMLAGRPAFTGPTVIAILHATLYEQPPALTGSPAVAAADRVIRRALAKKPDDRPESAEVMAAELRAVQGVGFDDTPALARALTRLVVLPFRVLRADPETDFLAFSLPDAISTSLSGLGSIVVRSSATAARFAGEAPDLKALAAEADVDRVVMGTLLRAGDSLRVAAQLVEAPGGTLLTAHTVQASLGDLFRLQDEIVGRVVQALSLPLGATTTVATGDVPRDPRAYELYLRANEVGRNPDKLPEARDLYERCLELDPSFAPAWAMIGRCHRVIGKFITPVPDSEERAEEAFRRALVLNPRLSIAHKFYANLEADMGHARQALERLLGQVFRHGNDPELFAGLVHACRYCGLYEQSIAAHGEARRLDPNVTSSVEMTLLLTCDVDRFLAYDRSRAQGPGDGGIVVIGLGFAGRYDEARQALAKMAGVSQNVTLQRWARTLTVWLDRRRDDLVASLDALTGLKINDDPEAMFQMGWMLCEVGADELGLTLVQRAVAKGYFAWPTLTASRAFDNVRRDPAFQAIVSEAETGRSQALAAFRETGGDRLLGL